MDFAVLVVTQFFGDDDAIVGGLTVIIFTLLDLCLFLTKAVMMESDLVVK